MQLEAVEIPRHEAREAYADYMRAARHEQDARARREMEQIAASYRLLAREDVALIALTPTIQRGGTVIRILEDNARSWMNGNYLLPRLAVCRADATFCFCGGIEADGSVRYADRIRFSSSYTSGLVELDMQADRPDDFKGRHVSAYMDAAWSAQVPIVPPKQRPRNGRANLRNYLVLWEVDEWTWRKDPAPSRDPALLRHVGGDVYAVVAQWDLTEIERLVLSGRRIEA